ncbi:MAG: glycosyltransferase [Methanobacteriaceae archaeon]|jgi:glycosyltransferase involved in cell wall biosynthesis
MKILFTQETDWIKRNPGQQHHLAEMLSLRGHEIRVIDFEILWRTEGIKEFYSKREVFNNVSKIHNGVSVTVVRPGIVKYPLLDYVSLYFSQGKEIHKQIELFVPDVIVGLGIFAYLSGRAAKKNNLPFIYYWTDVCHRLIPIKFLQPIGWLMERQTLKMADRVLTINDKLRDHVVTMGARSEQTCVLRAGINLEQFKPNINCNAVRKQYGFKEEDIILFFMGWVYDFSGLKEVAIKLANVKNPKLFIVGDGDAYEDLQRIQEKYNLNDRLILTGKKPYQEIPNFIAAADICLLPAYPDEPIMQDIVPIKMYEYMAMKKPVISTKLPGVMKEFGEDNGVVYVDRPEDVVPKAIELVQNGKVEELGAKARSFVEKYSWDKITDEFDKILDEVIKEKHR